MILLFFILGVALAALSVRAGLDAAPASKTEEVIKVERRCPPHPWKYANVNGVERLKCSACNMLPGEDTYQARGSNQ